MEKKSSTSKIITIVATIVAVCAIAILVIVLVNGRKNDIKVEGETPATTVNESGGEVKKEENTEKTTNSNEKKDEKVEKEEQNNSEKGGNNTIKPNDTSPTLVKTPDSSVGHWQAANGYQRSITNPSSEDGAVASNDKFVGFFKEDGVFRFEYGIYQTSYWIAGQVVKIEALDDNRYVFTLYIPATEDTEMEEGRPERMEIVQIHDVISYYNISIDSLGNGEYYTYEWAGATFEEAFSD